MPRSACSQFDAALEGRSVARRCGRTRMLTVRARLRPSSTSRYRGRCSDRFAAEPRGRMQLARDRFQLPVWSRFSGLWIQRDGDGGPDRDRAMLAAAAGCRGMRVARAGPTRPNVVRDGGPDRDRAMLAAAAGCRGMRVARSGPTRPNVVRDGGPDRDRAMSRRPQASAACVQHGRGRPDRTK